MRILMLIFAGLLTAAGADVANMSGTWRLNAGESDWNEKEPPKSIILTIEHREPALKISGLILESTERTNNFRFDGAVDGKEYPSDVGQRMYKRVNARTVESTYRSSDGRFSEKSITRMSRDGRRLTREIELNRPDGKLEWTEVYDKQ